MSSEKELNVAMEAAEAAGRLILEHYERFKPIPDAPADISTDTDHAAQETILTRIHRFFPADALCAEEKTATLTRVPAAGPRLWIIDPIDGTRGFARKNGEFTVMVAFVENGAVQVGVVLEPVPWKRTWAVRGGGCWRSVGPGGSPERCHVGHAKEFATATVTQSRSRTAKESPVVALLKPTKVVEAYSAGLKLSQVAVGEADIYANVYREFHDWDICAGHILVEEAGGTVTTFRGQPIRYGGEGFMQRGGMLASNGILHERAVQTLKPLMG
jgi:3'(2'), 5'-bisphosphate nucleotidase